MHLLTGDTVQYKYIQHCSINKEACRQKNRDDRERQRWVWPVHLTVAGAHNVYLLEREELGYVTLLLCPGKMIRQGNKNYFLNCNDIYSAI